VILDNQSLLNQTVLTGAYKVCHWPPTEARSPAVTRSSLNPNCMLINSITSLKIKISGHVLTSTWYIGVPVELPLNDYLRIIKSTHQRHVTTIGTNAPIIPCSTNNLIHAACVARITRTNATSSHAHHWMHTCTTLHHGPN
jgi:hypothetical protein